jgi:hypothetical protein
LAFLAMLGRYSFFQLWPTKTGGIGSSVCGGF